MTSKSPARSIEDVDATALSYAEVKMIATGDPRIKEKMDLDIQVAKLKLLRSNHMSQQYELEDKIIRHYPQKMAETQMFIEALTSDLPMFMLQAHPVKEDAFSIIIQGKTYTERKEIGFHPLPKDGLRKVPTTVLCRFANQLNTARRFMRNKAAKAKSSVDTASQIYCWRLRYDFC